MKNAKEVLEAAERDPGQLMGGGDLEAFKSLLIRYTGGVFTIKIFSLTGVKTFTAKTKAEALKKIG